MSHPYSNHALLRLCPLSLTTVRIQECLNFPGVKKTHCLLCICSPFFFSKTKQIPNQNTKNKSKTKQTHKLLWQCAQHYFSTFFAHRSGQWGVRRCGLVELLGKPCCADFLAACGLKVNLATNQLSLKGKAKDSLQSVLKYPRHFSQNYKKQP